jgi:HAMP domain-containing protein
MGGLIFWRCVRLYLVFMTRSLTRPIDPLEWIKSAFAQRKAHVEVLLEGLEHRDATIRFLNARRLLYILQGP